jgi:hypothetical protein
MTQALQKQLRPAGPEGAKLPVTINMKSRPQVFKMRALTFRYLFDQVVKK